MSKDTNGQQLSNKELLADYKKALDRALNTWDTAPKHLFDLADDIANGKVAGITFHRIDEKADVSPSMKNS